MNVRDRLPKNHNGEVAREIDKVMKAVNKAKLRLEADDQAITAFTVKQAYETQIRKQAEGQRDKETALKMGRK